MQPDTTTILRYAIVKQIRAIKVWERLLLKD